MVVSYQGEQDPPGQYLGLEDEVPGTLEEDSDGDQWSVLVPVDYALTMVLTQSSLPFVKAPGSSFDGLGMFMTRQHWEGSFVPGFWLCLGSVVTWGFAGVPHMDGDGDSSSVDLRANITRVVVLYCGSSVGILPQMQPSGFWVYFGSAKCMSWNDK